MVRFATFNVSFDRTASGMLRTELALDRAAQSALLARHLGGNAPAGDGNPEEIALARRVQQIRNVAEIIQRIRPDVLLLNEFDGDGQGESCADLQAFNDNYLAHAQHPEVESIRYPHARQFATNSGLRSGFDLNLDGKVDCGPDDAWGFGDYHGQYAFAVLSRHPIDAGQIRSFQHFKWRDLPGEQNPVIDDGRARLPTNRQPGEPWYEEAVWAALPLSSKNHVDLPLRIPYGEQERVVHFLISHPTPPIFGNAARHNRKRNRAEVAFWQHYIEGASHLVDDAGKADGLPGGERFVIAGDLNADPLAGDGDLSAIRALCHHRLVNQAVSTGALVPVSEGGQEYLATHPNRRNRNRPHPARITSTSGLQLDHLLPSANLRALASGVFWPASHEPGRHLVQDAQLGIGKGVSSDHRLVWVDLRVD